MKLEFELKSPTVIIAVGAPGCGKTTHLKPYAESINACYLNPDEIRQWVLGDELDRTDDSLVWDILHDALRLALKAGRHVIIDAKNTESGYRRYDVSYAKKHGAKKLIAAVFHAELDVCLQRNRERHRVAPDELIAKWHHEVETKPPTKTEGFDEVLEFKRTKD